MDAFRRTGAATGRVAAWPLATPRGRRGTGWVVGAVLAVWFFWAAIQRVQEGEVGVLVDNLTGELTVEDAVGYRFVVPIAQKLYTLDRKVQTLAMQQLPTGEFKGGDAIRIKTKDGNDVSIDLQVSYQLVASGAADVLRNAGPGKAFADLWVRPAVRAAVASRFGELATEDVYDASQRDDKARQVVKDLNEQLARRHVQVIAVVPSAARFFGEYEDLITRKKVADQDTITQKSQGELAKREQEKELKQADADKQQKVSKAKAEAENLTKQALGYATRVHNEADAELLTAQAEAAKTENEGLAEAHGLKEKADALAGAGGVVVVMLDYARKLAQASFSGTPIRADNVQSNVRVQQVPALTQPQPEQIGGGQAPGRDGPPFPGPASPSPRPGDHR